MAHKHEVLLVL